jgi:hypothetical protein
MPRESKEALDAKTGAVLNYPDILEAAQAHFKEPTKVEFMDVGGWLNDHFIGLHHDVWERLAFRLRQDLWDKTDPQKLREE